VGSELNFEGKSQSNARVSAFMRAIEASAWLKVPTLDVIQTESKATTEKLSDFTLHAKQGNQNAQAAGGK